MNYKKKYRNKHKKTKNKEHPQWRVLLADWSDSEVTAELPHLFKQAGCVVDVFCSQNSWLIKNSNWDNHIPSLGLSMQRYAEKIHSLASTKKYDWIVLVDDMTLGIVNSFLGDDDIARFVLPVLNQENRIMLNSKAGLHTLSVQNNILCPQGEIYRGQNIEDMLCKVSFPVLIKVDKSGGGKGIYLCEDKPQFLTQFNTLDEGQKKDVVIQEYIEGDNISVEALFKNGSVIAYSTSVVTKNTISEFSVSMSRVYVIIPEMKDILENIAKKLSLNGFSSMTFIRGDESKKYYLVEADMRAHRWFSLTRHVGVDFSLAIKHFLQNKKVSPQSNQKEMVMLHFPRIMMCAMRENDFKEIGRWVCNVENRWKFIPWHDKKLLIEISKKLTLRYLWHIYGLRIFFVIRPLVKSSRKKLRSVLHS